MHINPDFGDIPYPFWHDALNKATNPQQQRWKQYYLYTKARDERKYYGNKTSKFHIYGNGEPDTPSRLPLRKIKEITQQVLNDENNETKRSDLIQLFEKMVTRKIEKLTAFSKNLHYVDVVIFVLFCTLVGAIVAIPLRYWVKGQYQRLKQHQEELQGITTFTYQPSSLYSPTQKQNVIPWNLGGLPKEMNQHIFSFLSPADWQIISGVSKNIWLYAKKQVRNIVNEQFLPLREIYGCRTSAQIRECALHHRLTTINCGDLYSSDRTFLQADHLREIALSIPVKKLSIDYHSLDESNIFHLTSLKSLILRNVYNMKTLLTLFKMNTELAHLTLDFDVTFKFDDLQVINIPNLKTLSIMIGYMNGSGGDYPSNLNNLQDFTFQLLWGAPYQEIKFTQFISGSKDLRRLKLEKRDMEFSAISNIQELQNLTHLDLTSDRIGDEIIPSLLQMPNLKNVDLKTKVSEEGIQALADAGKTLGFMTLLSQWQP